MMAALQNVLRCFAPKFGKNVHISRIINTSAASMKHLHVKSALNGAPTLVGMPRICHSRNTFIQPCRCYSNDVSPVADRVLNCIKQYDKLTSAKVELESRFKEDLSMDSLDHVEMIMLLEDEFGFEIPDGDAEKMVTPAKIIEYLQEKQDMAS